MNINNILNNYLISDISDIVITYFEIKDYINYHLITNITDIIIDYLI